MNAILAALIRLAQRTGLFTEAQATNAYNGLWRKLAYALIACVIAFLLNASFGMKLPSLYLALVFAVVAFYVWAKPLHVLGVASTGLAAKIVSHEDLATEVKKVLEIYLELLKWVLIVGGVFLLITGTFSFKGNFEAGLGLLVSLGVVGLFIWKWPDVFVGTWGRRFFYTSALLIAIFSFVSIIPGPVWTKYTGWDPLTVKPTNTEDALYRLGKTRREMADAERATELERITSKVIRREALTQAEERFIAESQSQSTEKSTSQQAQQGCPHYSSLVDQGCTITEKPVILVTEEVTREGESELCYLKPPESAALLTRKVGVNSFEFRSAKGVFPIRYKLIRRIDMVNGECPRKF